MPMVQPMRMTATAPMADVPPSVEEKVMADKTRRRRRRIWYTLLQLLFISLLLILTVVWQRDVRNRQTQIHRVQNIAASLQHSLDQWKFLPAAIPDLKKDETISYVGHADRYFAMKQKQGRIIIGYTPLKPLTLHPDGRVVLIYEPKPDEVGKISAEWMSESELVHQLRHQRQAMKEFEKEQQRKPFELN